MRTWQPPQIDRDATPKLIMALQAEGLVVSRWEWRYIPQVNEFYLLVTTPSIAVLGPPAALQAQERAMKRAGVDAAVADKVRLIPE